MARQERELPFSDAEGDVAKRRAAARVRKETSGEAEGLLQKVVEAVLAEPIEELQRIYDLHRRVFPPRRGGGRDR